MPGLVPGIHVLAKEMLVRRGWPGQARPWWNKCRIDTPPSPRHSPPAAAGDWQGL